MIKRAIYILNLGNTREEHIQRLTVMVVYVGIWTFLVGWAYTMLILMRLQHA